MNGSPAQKGSTCVPRICPTVYVLRLGCYRIIPGLFDPTLTPPPSDDRMGFPASGDRSVELQREAHVPRSGAHQALDSGGDLVDPW